MHMHMMTIIWLMMDIVYQHVLRVLIVLIVEVLMPSLTTLSLLPLTVVLRLVSTHVHMPEMASVMTLVQTTTPVLMMTGGGMMMMTTGLSMMATFWIKLRVWRPTDIVLDLELSIVLAQLLCSLLYWREWYTL